MRKQLVSAAVVMTGLSIGTTVSASTVWQAGTSSTDWNLATNWTSGVPTATTNYARFDEAPASTVDLSSITIVSNVQALAQNGIITGRNTNLHFPAGFAISSGDGLLRRSDGVGAFNSTVTVSGGTTTTPKISFESSNTPTIFSGGTNTIGQVIWADDKLNMPLVFSGGTSTITGSIIGNREGEIRIEGNANVTIAGGQSQQLAIANVDLTNTNVTGRFSMIRYTPGGQPATPSFTFGVSPVMNPIVMNDIFEFRNSHITIDPKTLSGWSAGDYVLISNQINNVIDLGTATGLTGSFGVWDYELLLVDADGGVGGLDLVMRLIPEPTSLGLLSMGALGLLRRRRA